MISLFEGPEFIFFAVIFFSSITAIGCWQKIQKSTNQKFYKFAVVGSYCLVAALCVPVILFF